MKLIADEKIPGIVELFSDHFSVELLSDELIRKHSLSDTDVLITRATVSINQELLKKSRIKVVASPTSGTDHIDTDWLKTNAIEWLNAPGCNANAVAEYVVCCIARLQQQGFFNHKKLKAGVIGIGHVGSRVVNYLTSLGFDVIQNDPPRAAREPAFQSTPLSEFTDLDLICLHTPLTKSGLYPTYHLIEKNFLSQQKPHCVLLNAGRGAVINTADLLKYGKHCHWCFDVYENEPMIDSEILKQAVITTPHIAGYSRQAKWRGITMVYHGICELFQMKPKNVVVTPKNQIALNNHSKTWQQDVLTIFDPLDMTRELKQSPNVAETFLMLRNNYIFREEFSSARI